MHSKNQRGLAALEAILFVIIFVIIGFVGWYVVNSNQKANDQLNQAANTKLSPPTKKSASSTGTKFVFKELGVEFELPTDLKGLTSTARVVSDGTVYDLSTPELISTVEKCYNEKPSAEDMPYFGSLSEFAGQYKPSFGDTAVLLKQFDTFSITIGYPNGITSCTAPGVDQNLMSNKSKALSESFVNAFQKTATKVQ